MNEIRADALASVSDLQRHYAALLRKTKKSGCPLWLLKDNKPTAVLLDNDFFTEMAEKARLYEETNSLAAISEYKKEKDLGKLKKMKEVDELVHII